MLLEGSCGRMYNEMQEELDSLADLSLFKLPHDDCCFYPVRKD